MRHNIHLTRLINKMIEAGQPRIAIANFQHHYLSLLHSGSKNIREQDIELVPTLESDEHLHESLTAAGRLALKRTAMLKLNGGLGTSVGLDKAKSLIKIKCASSRSDQQ